jgi:hypothetical protein
MKEEARIGFLEKSLRPRRFALGSMGFKP